MAKKKSPADAANALMQTINKSMGEGTVVLGSEIREDFNARITTGSLSLDWALGGGFTVNQWHGIVGEYSSGKTAVALKTVAANQAADPAFVALWIAAEELDPAHAADLGVDMDRLIVVQRNEMEIVLQIVLEYARSQTVDMIVIDSLPALVPMTEDERDMDQVSVAAAAKIVNQFFRKNGPAMKRSLVSAERPITGLIINQFREKIGVMMGDNRTSPGGRGKEFAFYTMTEVKRGAMIADDSQKMKIHRRGTTKVTAKPVLIGQEIRVKVFKNKSAAPMREAVVDFYFQEGVSDDVKHAVGEFDLTREISTLGESLGVLAFEGGKWRDRESTFEWKNRGQMEDAIVKDEMVRATIAEQIREVM